MARIEDFSVAEVGDLLRRRATHHDHGDGWTYTRDIGGLKHIRFERDYTGYNHWTKRLRRALDWKHLVGRDTLTSQLRGDRKEDSLYQKFLFAKAYVKVNLFKDSNLPDGSVGGNYVFWEEDGEYIEMVGPTIGALVAEFLMEEPENEHAQAIAGEIRRILAKHGESE